VREAVEYAIDKEGITKAFSYGYGMVPYQIVPPVCTLAYNPDFTLGRKFDLDKAKQLLAEAGYSNGFETTFILLPTANKNMIIALQDNLAKIGIKVNLDFPEMGKWANYMNPRATWHNAALYYAIPAISGVDFAVGLQFLFNMLGTSWLRPPELNEAYQAFLSSPTIEIENVRAVTDMITKEALIIPTDSAATGSVMRNNVFITTDERSNQLLSSVEDWWLNK
jgi:ABC-type transport system substrate-binding protein